MYPLLLALTGVNTDDSPTSYFRLTINLRQMTSFCESNEHPDCTQVFTSDGSDAIVLMPYGQFAAAVEDRLVAHD